MRTIASHEPPAAHVMHSWNADTRTLQYAYNGSPLLAFHIPDGAEPYYREYSNGNLQSRPLAQQLYLALDRPATVKVRFRLSKDAINMRPQRATEGQAILGQIGKPLLHGVNGLYDVLQDLLIDWHGAEWSWTRPQLEQDSDGNWQAEMEVRAGRRPWIVNLRMHYYREHLHYQNHRPWEWRPKLQPIAGWSTWEAFAQHVTAADIERSAAHLKEHLQDYGLEFIQLDDGYQTEQIPPNKEGIAADAWLQTNDRFPGGHDGILSAVRERGFQAGIWTSAMVTNREFAYDNRDSFEKDADGNPLCGEWIYYVLKGEANTLKEQAAPLYKGLKEHGYSYFKTDQIRHYLYDGLHKAVVAGSIDSDEASRQLRAYLTCAREQLDDDDYFLACWGVLTEAVGLVDACRIAGDSNPTWPAICKQIVESARWYHTHRILFVNDPDYVCMRTEEAWGKSLLSLVTLSGGVLMISDNTDLYDADRRYATQRCLPALPTSTGETGPLDLSYPLDLSLPKADYKADPSAAFALLGIDAAQQLACPTASLWAFHFQLPHRSWCVAGRFAVVPLPSAELELESLALSPDKAYYAFDFWRQRYIGKFEGTIVLEKLELGHCQIVGLTEVEAYPRLIASSRHVSMDAVSVRNECWDNNELLLELDGVKGTTENYWIAVPPDYEFKEHEASGLTLAGMEHGDGEWIQLRIRFDQAGGGHITLRFI
ncbi:alpha-galactosidase [Paenibacillus sp. J5C_2022]|uniref:alpha-galactosidase n=1 Tax=Paenibacillus sp. J5C2022 TaxID=2977129 RepID=UPI0021CEB84D|nr:alpha-galactosidase [Paenibacillus sp. J5C2022]MCU6707751.1 alpha-galactosidase [Paenibacillus sp. J5C2022]